MFCFNLIDYIIEIKFFHFLSKTNDLLILCHFVLYFFVLSIFEMFEIQCYLPLQMLTLYNC